MRTKADVESEEAILMAIKKAFPGFNIYSEEAGRIHKSSEYTFVIDPLDGSNNFVLGIPCFTVSIALMKGDESIAGVIYNPILNKTYHAITGQGSYVDKDKLRVNQEANIQRSTIAYACGYANSGDEKSDDILHKLNKHNIKRSLSSWSPALDLCLLASGKIEGIINNKTDLYDYAAGRLIAREAGAKITDFNGRPDSDQNDLFVVSNGTAIHDVLLGVIED